MEIKSLLGFINRDIQEVEQLTAGMSAYDKIPQFDIDLTLSKIKTITGELEMLNRLNSAIVNQVDHSFDKKQHFPDQSVQEKNQEVITEPVQLKKQDVIPKPPESDVVESALSTGENAVGKTVAITEAPAIHASEMAADQIITSAVPEVTKIRKKNVPEVSLAGVSAKPVEPQVVKKLEDEKPENEIQSKKSGRSIGDKLKNEKKSLIDVISENIPANDIKAKLKANPITDIRSAIPLNDKIWFSNELFGGNSEKMNLVIETLNKMGALSEAIEYLSANFTWDGESAAAGKFRQLLERRFS